MCKLSGMVKKDNSSTSMVDFITLLSLMRKNSALSNKDGVGFHVGGEIDSLWKSSDSMAVVLGTEAFGDWVKGLVQGYNVPGAIIGHVRQATSGKGTDKDANSHPFKVNNIVLAHNGHFGNYADIAKELELPKEIEVDSEVFAHALAKEIENRTFDPEAHLQPAIDQFTGSFTLLVADLNQPNKIFAVVGDNPLSLYETEKYYILNTDPGLTDNLRQMLDLNNLQSEVQDSFIEKTTLTSDTVYALTSEGIKEICNITPHPTITTYKGWQGGAYSRPPLNSQIGPGTSRSAEHITINFSAMVDIAKLRSLLLLKFELTDDMLDSFLSHLLVEELPDNAAKLNDKTLKKLEEFFNFAVDRKYFSPDDMPEVHTIWSEYISRVYQISTTISPLTTADKLMGSVGFNTPYWFNSIEVMRRLLVNSNSTFKINNAVIEATVH